MRPHPPFGTASSVSCLCLTRLGTCARWLPPVRRGVAYPKVQPRPVPGPLTLLGLAEPGRLALIPGLRATLC